MQNAQNIGARYVCKFYKRTRLEKLLNECNWLTIHQLIVFHSIMLMQRILKDKYWSLVKEELEVMQNRKVKEGVRQDFTRESWHWRKGTGGTHYMMR